MQRPNADSNSLSARRAFLKSSGGAPAGLYLAGTGSRAGASDGKHETLALNGGPKAVTVTLRNFTRWPVFGEEEEKEVVAYLRDPGVVFVYHAPFASECHVLFTLVQMN